MFILEKLPNRKKDIFAWADYLEFRCVTEPDKQITVADVSDSVEEAGDFSVDVDIHSHSQYVAERNDILEAHITEYMEFLESRKSLFKDAYPFDLSSNKIELKKDLNPEQIGYLILLFSSCLRNIESNHREVLTTSFEYITQTYFRALLSSQGEAHVISSKNNEIGATAIDRIKWVAKKLGSSIICDEDEFLGNVAGEKGLDVVAWLDLGDELNNRPIFLIQATCGDSVTFELKAAQVSFGKWRKIIEFDAHPVSVLSIPHSYRKQSNVFGSNIVYGDAVLIDRSRILQQVKDFKSALNDESYNGICGMIFGDSLTSMIESE